MTDDKLKPTQADREAAAQYFRDTEGDSGEEMAGFCLSGCYDTWTTVQAFARHRIAATDTQVSKHSEPVCANCEGLLGDLAAGRDPEELCDTCYEDSQSTAATLAPQGKLTGEWYEAALASVLLMKDVDTFKRIIVEALRQAPDAQVSSLVSAPPELLGTLYHFSRSEVLTTKLKDALREAHSLLGGGQ